MLPLHRLATLLEQAKSYQRGACLYHANAVAISLLADCACDPSAFPSITSYILREHTDEIWRLEFSHDGKWLATAGKDKTVIIWNVREGFTVEKVLNEHVDSISCLSWSPDDSILLTAAEVSIKMWNTVVRFSLSLSW
jgi:WD40 repeat protein